MENDDSSVMIVEDVLDNEFWIKDGVLIKHLSLSSTVPIPDSLQSMGRYALDGCTSLRSLTVPAGVTFIDDPAFADCARSESLHIHDVDPSSVDPASVEPPQYTVCVYAGSYAEKYVKERNIPFEII